jgi:microcystin-dependent protein
MNIFFKRNFYLILFIFCTSTISAQVTDALIITPQGNVNVVSGKVQESGNDLLPKGAIIMWSGTTAPAGWAICDGSLYAIKLNETQYSKIPKQDEGQYANNPTVIRTPDLIDKFILGAGGKFKPTGGNALIKIEEKHLPPHTHEVESAGEHSHTFYYDIPGKEADPTNNKIFLDFNGNAKTGLKQSYATGTQSAGSHIHTLKKTGKGDELEIIPPYYALYYIMKL